MIRTSATLVVMALLALAAMSSLASPGLAAKGGGLTTTITLSQQTPTKATFTVTRSVPYDKDTIWVTNKCWDATGNLVQRQDNPVLWGTTVSLVGTTWPFPTEDGVTCTAYVTLRPWQDRPLGDAILTYVR